MILDGKAVAAELIEDLKNKLANSNKKPYLVVILVGDNPASQVYVNNKKKKAEYIGVKTEVIHYDTSVSEAELLNKIEELNNVSITPGTLKITTSAITVAHSKKYNMQTIKRNCLKVFV